MTVRGASSSISPQAILVPPMSSASVSATVVLPFCAVAGNFHETWTSDVLQPILTVAIVVVGEQLRAIVFFMAAQSHDHS